ncbi:hypothetical protein [Agrobacterium sp. SORGH_AS 787]|uniref:hypothetical protein n=1 Tax=Agrobacterium sp. SORGH_AS 787 TaxID=3041775 RepID=UPI002783D6B9|nr:hypothetical protein [Rhizobium sp. SORGH_AS_0787]
MSFDLVGAAVATKQTGTNVPLPDLQPMPTACAGRTDAETLGSLPMRSAAVNCGKHAHAKTNGKGFRHICRPPSADSLNQNESELRINLIQSVSETL